MLAKPEFRRFTFDEYEMDFPICYNILEYKLVTDGLVSPTTVARAQSCGAQADPKCRVLEADARKEQSFTF
jgi:hypothetical protein